MVKNLLQLESFMVLFTSVVLYSHYNGNWWMFAILLFAPDISMLGYIANRQVGTITYNIVHNYTLPLILIVGGILFPAYITLTQLGLIWSTHIGFDRVLGYRLKYPTNFKDTHLNKM